MPPASLEGGPRPATVDSPSKGQPSTTPAPETRNHGAAQQLHKREAPAPATGQPEEGHPGTSLPQDQPTSTYHAWYTARGIHLAEQQLEQELHVWWAAYKAGQQAAQQPIHNSDPNTSAYLSDRSPERNHVIIPAVDNPLDGA